ncbi:MAG: glycosyltransferase family 4 protein [Spartobacteria bacterium]|nr:glycosyltransferase family 4 protein [Spartobacteria bacterium]
MGNVFGQDMRQVKILFAIKTLSGPVGGAEKLMAAVCNAMLTKGHAVSLLTFDRPTQASTCSLDSQVRRLFVGVGDSQQRATVFVTARRILALRRLVRAERPDVVIAFMHSMFVPMALALLGTGVPVVASEHTAIHYYRKRPLDALLWLLSLRFVRYMTVTSRSVQRTLPGFLKRRVTVIYNFVSAEGDDRVRAGATRSEHILLNVGRLSPEKGQKAMLRAFALIKDRFPEWQLRIVGAGSLRVYLQRLIEELDLQDRVVLVGALKDVRPEYSNADIFLMPSKFESFGLATAEALSHGLPVIGFASCPGTNELVAHGENGLLVDGEDRVKALADGMARLMDDAELRATLSTSAKRSVERFSERTLIKRWDALVYMAANRKNAPVPTWPKSRFRWPPLVHRIK